MIWLRFLARPEQHAELLGSILPHRFRVDKECHTASAELQAFIDWYQATQGLLARAFGGEPAAAERTAWETLVRRVVKGSHEDDALSALKAPLRAEAHAAVEELMHDLERWSIELQRHCPEDWNQCSAIV